MAHNKRISVKVWGIPEWNSGVMPLAIFNSPSFKITDIMYSGFDANSFFFTIKIEADQVVYKIIKNHVRPHSAFREASLAIGMSIPRGYKLDGGYSPYDVLVALKDTFLSLCMTCIDPIKERYQYNSGFYEDNILDETANRFTISPADGPFRPMTDGGPTGYLTASSDNIRLLMNDVHYNEFSSYGEIILAPIAEAPGYAQIENLPIPRVQEFSFIKNGLKDGFVRSTSERINICGEKDSRRYLPDLRSAIENSSDECKPGYTDVYFFGTHGAGRTSILMGLASCNSLYIDLSSGGGRYAEALQQYTAEGMTVPRTPGMFVCTLNAKIRSKATPNIVHKINLVEMSGQELSYAIANNECITLFDCIGPVAELLKNNNRKVFFLIIDPTANIVTITREKEVGKDAEGKPIIKLEHCSIQQSTILNRMVNLLAAPENREIMRKVDSIHIIMTKADTLGNAVEREEKALNIFQGKYSSKILSELVELCKEHNINAQNNFQPKLYTFSLGSFYKDGLFEYDPTDSDRLVEAIEETIQSCKNKSWWNRIKRIFNK